MKKALLGLFLAPLALASCGNCNNGICNNSGDDKVEIYSGILPAADAEGILYTLRLDYDDDHNFTDGDYDLTQTALVSDSTAMAVVNDGPVNFTEGDFRIQSKNVNGTDTRYIRLVPKAKKSLGAADNSTLYFLVNGDNTLTLVNADLTKAANDSLNYTLTLKN